MSGSACSLPPEKVFSIQIGSDLFRLSGASIASDAPSYFSRFFEEQVRASDASNCRTLYIDRDPVTFRDIARHLQELPSYPHELGLTHLGYHVRPRDGPQFVKLFADSQFYSLPRLMSQLFESEIFIQIGDRHFEIPRDIFSGPGDSPNFFTLGFGAFFASPSEVFPGLDRTGLLRPPAITPPSVPNRSADVFADLLHILRGYQLHIRNEEHRAELLRDCRYFHLRGVEQKLIPHNLSINPFTQRPEVTIRLEDIRPSGIHFFPDKPASPILGLVGYARPHVDEKPADLILQTGDDAAIIDRRGPILAADFLGNFKSRMTNLLQVVGKKIDLPDPQQLSGMPVKVRLGRDVDLNVDGENDPQFALVLAGLKDDEAEPPAKRQRSETPAGARWLVRNAQWKLQLQPNGDNGLEPVLFAIKLDLYTSQRVHNRARNFL
ncbi:hypothetical protein N7509_011545 [Penicillium cosmopolitanum]|uniref:Potassium channel tetramerisation-type BTB domain-containing protein n=1 Tax=Penicillium cosmopolitanum TaxID=1131564 RepID=A0A9W9SGY8_9EURO|nr:uncharacterized protein N7509_011545 [Penicillium cosmopolitanum]KAJ5378426.1 hypothetical protein N7509_011545 [Penicillium cosmopolitanum]